MSICARSGYFLTWLSAWIAGGRSLLRRNLNGNCIRQATSQVQADTKDSWRLEGLVRSCKILVVDDFDRFRQFVILSLRQRAEFQLIYEASDGLEAVERSEELKPDLILLDIGLPRVNGIEAGRRIRKVSPNSKILFVSQESSADVVQEALRLGAQGYLLKADAAGELLPAVDAVLQGRQYLSRPLRPHGISKTHE